MLARPPHLIDFYAKNTLAERNSLELQASLQSRRYQVDIQQLTVPESSIGALERGRVVAPEPCRLQCYNVLATCANLHRHTHTDPWREQVRLDQSLHTQ